MSNALAAYRRLLVARHPERHATELARLLGISPSGVEWIRRHSLREPRRVGLLHYMEAGGDPVAMRCPYCEATDHWPSGALGVVPRRSCGACGEQFLIPNYDPVIRSRHEKHRRGITSV